MKPKSVFVNQQDNFQGKFGIVLRSSALFYYKKTESFKTTISFMDYWKFKRGLNVAVIASVRDMSGKLHLREKLLFEEGNVINYRPEPLQEQDFEGSVEIEVFSTQNMVIPYSAITAIYETLKGISIVHSYARAYSRHEVEDKLCISNGEESCWTIRDTQKIRSFAIFHNGPLAVPVQDAQLRLLAHDGRTLTANFKLEALQPYQTVKIIPSDYFSNIVEFLEGKPGNVSFSFYVGEGFSRMLVGNETVNGDDCQVTHSNFDYSRHETDKLESSILHAYMHVPSLDIAKKEVIVYPACDPGKYQINAPGISETFTHDKSLSFPYMQGTLVFSKPGHALPSRIVTAIISQKNAERIPNECSLGVLTAKQPTKRMWWGSFVAGKDLASKLIIHDLPEVFGGMPEGAQICVRIYSKKGHEYLEANLPVSALPKLGQGIRFDELIPKAPEFLASDFGYYTVYSDYGGLTCYSTFENAHGSFAFEHGF